MQSVAAATNLSPHPPNKTQRATSLTKQHGFFYFIPTSRITSLSSNSKSFTSTAVSPLLLSTTNLHKTDFNKEICRACEVGNLKNAISLLCRTPTSQIEANTYHSVLQLCAEKKSLEDGKNVHSIISSTGAVVDTALGSKLVFMYLNCGDLRDGRRIFDEIVGVKVFLWNFIMSEYAKVGNYRESIYLFKKMRRLGVEPNDFTFSCVLKCFGALGSLVEGEEVHGYLLKLGYGSYNTVVNALMTFYSKCMKMESAHKIFDELSDRDVISWNVLISGYSSNGLAEKALELFSLMRFDGFEADVITMVSLLPACVEMGNLSFGRALHGQMIKTHSFLEDIRINNALLDLYAKCGDLDSGVQLFGKMERRSVISWTSMLLGYARQGYNDRAIELFWKMQEAGVEPDAFTVTSILHVCACNGSLETGKDIHDYISKKGLLPNLFVANVLMDMYAKCGNMEAARLVFDGMLVRDAISWNTMIRGYSKNSFPNEALHLFMEMQLEFKPTGVTMACVLPACASLSALHRGREIHGYVLRNGFSSELTVTNALIDMYAKCGALLLARILFDSMPTKNLVSWTVMIAGYGMHGFGGEAITTFNDMRHSGIEPDSISFVAILYACSHSGLLGEGREFFDIMRNDCKIEPKLEHYACMVDLLARAGRLTKAFKFIEAMPVKPDSNVWEALLCGCRTHRDVNLAEKVADKLFELDPENTGYYVLLANIYSEAEKWEEVKELRTRIGRRGPRKSPGCSWIEMNGKVHIFLSGDRSHPQYKRIESLLQNVIMRGMKQEAIHPNKRYALNISGDAQKEEPLCGHSAKLATTYGILNSPYEKTLRVTTNLRMCDDCHETAKFMSKRFAREIILRDANRFHHFKDGRCSCRGYW